MHGLAEPVVVPVAVVLAGDPDLRAEIVALLHAAGLGVAASTAVVPDLVILPLGSSDPQAMAEVGVALKVHPGTPLLVVLPADTTGARLRRAVRVGAHGVVTTDRLGEALAPSAAALLAGQLAVPPAVRRQLAPTPLSHREKQVLNLVVAGYTNRQIADALYLSESTVKTHVSSAFAKLDARSRAEAAAIVLDPEDGLGLGVLSTGVDGRVAAA
ncbi:MAG TPA: response regulator transcription factor [Solirubrobacteraceae bacterium]|jgi:DNA-binding NarL/FixJ family response regulator|nr:response regulator transcription factor [Solirubrobacteraceae bacterium]